MKMFRVMLLLLAAGLGVTPAVAAGSREAFVAGRMADAARAGRAEGTADGLILAGRATSMLAAWQTPDRARAKALLEQAEQDLARALKLQPGNADALLQQGIVVGYIAKLERSPGTAKRARLQFEAVLAARPADPLALAAMGGWHGEAVVTLGKLLARTALGAKVADSLRFYDRAVATTGGDPAVPIFYASTLLGLSADNGDKAKALLQRAVRARPRDGFERLLQANARAILVPLEKGDIAAAREAARRLGPLGSV